MIVLPTLFHTNVCPFALPVLVSPGGLSIGMVLFAPCFSICLATASQGESQKSCLGILRPYETPRYILAMENLTMFRIY